LDSKSKYVSNNLDSSLTKRAKTGGLVEDLDNMLKRRKIEQK
jgi:hypothetical protein